MPPRNISQGCMAERTLKWTLYQLLNIHICHDYPSSETWWGEPKHFSTFFISTTWGSQCPENIPKRPPPLEEPHEVGSWNDTAALPWVAGWLVWVPNGVPFLSFRCCGLLVAKKCMYLYIITIVKGGLTVHWFILCVFLESFWILASKTCESWRNNRHLERKIIS